ncbi:MAG: hypothetical protein DRP18_00320 [Candidatus Aenigmatarchaeota archaeon]|nr:MAG: hypothetical protein DRP18_00320 [Candidatus Aenigmarchaeota archaeon]
MSEEETKEEPEEETNILRDCIGCIYILENLKQRFKDQFTDVETKSIDTAIMMLNLQIQAVSEGYVQYTEQEEVEEPKKSSLSQQPPSSQISPIKMDSERGYI